MLPFRVVKHARLKRYSTPLPFQKRKISWQQSYKQGIILPDIAEIKPTHIIVGAGSAGCVLANRLSENPDNRVLLIEAGPRDHWWDWRIHMPAALMYNLCHDQYNWYYHTTAQKNLNNRVLYWPRGRVWGGSSTLNAMCFIRGNAADYDRWEEEGAVGWNFSNCLPYFKKMEAYQGNADLRVRGKDGPVHVRQAPADHPLHQAFLQAGEFHPIGTTKDLNGEKQAGIGRIDQTIKNGERWSASRAYLHSALERKNLFTSSGITCTKILTHKNRAIGIEFIRKLNFVGTDNIDSYSREKIYCEGDVILSGGAINSPHLLMISGIGPADHLRSMEIPVVLDLPGVGQNLQDHLEIYVQQKCSQPITLYDKSSWKFPHNMVRIGLEWLANRSGLASSSHLETGGFASSTSAVPYPDIQFHFLPSTVHDDGRKEATCHAFQVHVGPLRSKSSGAVTLQHKDPRRYPHMNPNYMSCDEDWKEFRRSIRMAREIFATKPFDPFRGVELAPGDSIQSDAELNNFIRAKAASAYHPSCSCKMGSSNDRMAVVNPENMSVYGIENLKVIDASVMPSIITGNLNAPTMMLAERAADLIQGKK